MRYPSDCTASLFQVEPLHDQCFPFRTRHPPQLCPDNSVLPCHRGAAERGRRRRGLPGDTGDLPEYRSFHQYRICPAGEQDEGMGKVVSRSASHHDSRTHLRTDSGRSLHSAGSMAFFLEQLQQCGRRHFFRGGGCADVQHPGRAAAGTRRVSRSTRCCRHRSNLISCSIHWATSPVSCTPIPTARKRCCRISPDCCGHRFGARGIS